MEETLKNIYYVSKTRCGSDGFLDKPTYQIQEEPYSKGKIGRSTNAHSTLDGLAREFVKFSKNPSDVLLIPRSFVGESNEGRGVSLCNSVLTQYCYVEDSELEDLAILIQRYAQQRD